MSDDQPEKPAPQSARRRIKGLIVRPKAQLKYSFMLVGVGSFLLTIVLLIIMITLNQVFTTLEIAYGLDGEVTELLRKSLLSTLGLCSLLSLVFGSFTVFFSLQMSHRIYGPLVPIQRHIIEMKNGNYSSRIKLRRDDDLKEVMDSLNDLAESLETQSSSRVPLTRAASDDQG